MMKIWIITTIHPRAGRPLRASSIQNIRTAAALAESGCPTLLWMAGSSTSCRTDLEQRLGQALSPHLHFLNYRPRGGKEAKKTPFHSLATCAWNFFRAQMEPTRSPDIILTRSPLVLEQLSGVKLCPSGALKILEWQYPEYMQLWRGWSRRHPHALPGESRKFLCKQRQLEFTRLQYADGILCAAEDHNRLLADAGYPRPSRIFPSGCPRYPDSNQIVEKKYDFGYVGSISPDNGIETIAHSLARVPHGRLLLLGSGPTGYKNMLRKLVMTLNLEDRVDLKNWAEPYRIGKIMSTCQVGLVPISRACGPEKRQFSSPLKLVEWMAAGIPVIASRVPSVMHRLGDSGSAYIVEPDNPQDLADAMRKLQGNQDLRRQLVSRGINIASQSAFEHRARKLIDFAEMLRSS